MAQVVVMYLIRRNEHVSAHLRPMHVSIKRLSHHKDHMLHNYTFEEPLPFHNGCLKKDISYECGTVSSPFIFGVVMVQEKKIPVLQSIDKTPVTTKCDLISIYSG